MFLCAYARALACFCMCLCTCACAYVLVYLCMCVCACLHAITHDYQHLHMYTLTRVTYLLQAELTFVKKPWRNAALARVLMNSCASAASDNFGATSNGLKRVCINQKKS